MQFKASYGFSPSCTSLLEFSFHMRGSLLTLLTYLSMRHAATLRTANKNCDHTSRRCLWITRCVLKCVLQCVLQRVLQRVLQCVEVCCARLSRNATSLEMSMDNKVRVEVCGVLCGVLHGVVRCSVLCTARANCDNI